jgi:hypothetical protein
LGRVITPNRLELSCNNYLQLEGSITVLNAFGTQLEIQEIQECLYIMFVGRIHILIPALEAMIGSG